MDDLQIGPVTIAGSELEERFSRASGPGGQHVNTTDSRVQLSWNVAASPSLNDAQRARLLRRLQDRLVDGVLTITSSERRSQLLNRQTARERLAEIVTEALRPPAPPRRPTRPTRGSQERRIASKKLRGDTKRDRRPPDTRGE